MDTGPGAIAEDGSAVEVYARLPAFGEPEIVHAAISPGAEVLELGCGAGRVTHPLLRLGHPVVAVDSSADMLDRVHGATKVLSRIEDLALGRRFPVVLLGSHLVNDVHPLPLLASCARHVASDGVVLIERYPPDWVATASEGESALDGVTYRLHDVSRPGPGLLRATMDYELDGYRWSQSFEVKGLDDDQLAEVLAAVGLVVDEVLTPDRTWVLARPAS